MHQPILCINQISRDQVRCDSVAVVVEIYLRMAFFDLWPTRVAVMKRQKDDVSTCHEVANKFAYVSLLFSADAPTVLHAIVLGRSLQHTGTVYARLLLVTPDVHIELQNILRVFWDIVLVPTIDSHCIDPKLLERIPQKRRNVEANMFLKFELFDATKFPYEKVLFLDIDTVVLRNIDFVFGFPTPSAVPCYGNYKYGKQNLSDADYHEEGDLMPQGTTFNGGVMLLTPNNAIYEIITRAIRQPSLWHISSTHPSSRFLKDVMNWYALAADMNLCVMLTKGQAFTRKWLNVDFEQINVLHFMGSSKPSEWLHHHKIEPFYQYWWRQVKLPSNFDYATWARLELRAKLALETYAKFSIDAIFLSASKTGWHPFRHALSHVCAVAAPKTYHPFFLFCRTLHVKCIRVLMLFKILGQLLRTRLYRCLGV